jgi:hypothetical protein
MRALEGPLHKENACNPSLAEAAGEGYVFCVKPEKSRFLLPLEKPTEGWTRFFASVSAILRAFCYAGFLRRMRCRGRIF